MREQFFRCFAAGGLAFIVEIIQEISGAQAAVYDAAECLFLAVID
jgi:hypothetical protein